MASSGNRKTTMAKLNRERKLRERRFEKQARKDARKQASADQRDGLGETPSDGGEDEVSSDAEGIALDPVVQSLSDS